MQTITYGKSTLVTNLTWSVLDPFDSKYKQIQGWRSAGQAFGVSYQVDGETVYGRTGQAAKGYISLAALAGRHPLLKGATALLLIEIPSATPDEESRVVAVGLVNGIVEEDRLIDESEVPDFRSTFATKAKVSYKVFGHGHHVGNIDEPLSLDGLLKTGARKAALTPLSSGLHVRVALAAALVLGISMLAYTWIQGELEARRVAEAMRLNQSKTPQQLYLLSIEQYLKRPIVPLHSAIAATRAVLNDFPVVHAGWNLSRVNCMQSGCTVAWVRNDKEAGTIEDFRRTAPQEWGDITPISQVEVAHPLALQMPTRNLERDAWPQLKIWRDENLASWQFLAPGGWSSDLSEPRLRAVPPEIEGGPQMGQIGAMPEAIRAVDLTINRMPLWYAEDDPDSPMRQDLLGDQTALQGDIQIDLDGTNITFTLKGLLHVQN